MTLRNVPLLMHWAWQEHAQALLREYLLFTLDSDSEAISHHAHASEALTVLYSQIPVPELPDDPEELLADAVEPGVTADELLVSVPLASVAQFATLDNLLRRAVEAASSGLFLSPPTQPEIREMREWICEEVARQTVTSVSPVPWSPRTDARVALREVETLKARFGTALKDERAFLATDDASIIVAACPSIVQFLGYDSESELVGRRVIVVIPQRYHQAHIAGTTLHATNGRDQLLHVPVMVPVVRADGSEMLVELEVTSRRLDEDTHVFVAYFALPALTSGPA